MITSSPWLSLIHPDQVAIAHKVEVAFAEKVVEAFLQAERYGPFYAFADNKLVDPPVFAKAQHILKLDWT